MHIFCVFYLFSLPEDRVTPLTVLATRETLYLLNEDHQWSKSLPHPSANENGEPCSGRVTVQETQPISCVSSVHLWSTAPCTMHIKLYDEVRLREERDVIVLKLGRTSSKFSRVSWIS